jgi:thiopurine S-methyltransferase
MCRVFLSGVFMEHDFWHRRWTNNQIAFHESHANAMLVANVHELCLSKGSCVFLPLCGMTLDIEWFLTQGHHVVGAELSELAVTQLFKRLNVTPAVETKPGFACHSAPNLEIFVGDVFNVTSHDVGKVDAVYDRAALVALPQHMRPNYAQHLFEQTRGIQQLVITFEYDQNLTAGPPFSVDGEEIYRLYGKHYTIRELMRKDLPNGLRGTVPAAEVAWLLSPS